MPKRLSSLFLYMLLFPPHYEILTEEKHERIITELPILHVLPFYALSLLVK